MKIALRHSFFLLLLAGNVFAVEGIDDMSGREIMDEVYSRHEQYPYVYEEQSMVMRDRNGKRDTRTAHRYSRVEEDGTARFMLIFDYPEEIDGVAVLATRDPEGVMRTFMYLPAFAEQMIESKGDSSYGSFLGTDFSVENIVGEELDNYHYERKQDRNVDDVKYFVIDVFRTESHVGSEPPVRRHFVRKDNLFISLTEHYDNHGRLHKKQTHHDLKAVDGDMWRSNMILMEDYKEQHQSLLKVNRRFFSHDYVPENMFSEEWLYENHPYVEPEPEESMEEIELSTEEQLSQAAEEGALAP